DGTSIDIKDPFEQGKGNKYALIRKIESLPEWYGRLPTIGHAVAFPDGNIDISDLGLSAPDEIVLLRKDMADLNNWVKKCLEFWTEGNFIPLGEERFAVLKNLLRKSWLMRDPKIGEELALEKTLINKYTDNQMMVLDFIAAQPRAAIRGCAGSGKTILARQKALKLAREGFKTLLTCYNRNLADELAHSVGNIPGLTIMNFHSLCQYYAGLTGFTDSDKWNQKDANFFNEIMPEALAYAADWKDVNLKFDAIIVDEGQDFHPSWWLALEMIFNDQKNGIFYVFFDDNQNVYAKPEGLPVDIIPYPLNKNCRNTRNIHKIIENFYKSDLIIESVGPIGREVKIHIYGENSEIRKILTEILSRLIYAENIKTQDIVFLSLYGLEHEPLSFMANPGIFRLVEKKSPGPDEIYATTIRLFKGLEKPVVILLIPENFNLMDEMIYVGTSRATGHLEIIVHQNNSKFDLILPQLRKVISEA
ncbi:MAG: AAA family ATPase, partial [Anaerolineaceae bacterium]|nr:AAA family ATPase [Anaerolineaceae bacterium]